MKHRLPTLVLVTAWSVTAMAQPLPYQNPDLPAAERAADLCQRLTLEEKIQLMTDRSPAIGRLGLPAFEWWNEALHGVARNGTATVFPITMAMAASFDDDLVHDVFSAASDEARAKNTEARRTGRLNRYRGLSFWTPNINIFRDPRWGRGQETYGEDPYLTSRMGLAVVRGLQGEGGRYRKLLACAKHFAVHSGPEWNRHQFDIETLPLRDLYETYLPAFKTLVQEAEVAEVMCAYNRFENEPCCGNNRLLQRILRDEWGFQGIVTSDCGALDDFWMQNRHDYSPDAPTAAAEALRAGTDVECLFNTYSHLAEAVRAGQVSESDIDRSVRRLMQARIELGDLDPDSLVEWTQIPMSIVANEEHRDLALRAARESIVLLQNRRNLLPIDEHRAPRIVVMGENAVDTTMQWGNYNGFPRHTVSILEGIRSFLPSAIYKEGFGLIETSPEAVAALSADEDIRRADVVVYVGGISPRLEGEEMNVKVEGFQGGDRTSIELPATQRNVLTALHAASKRVVFVNCSGSAIALAPETANCEAILQAWYPGEAGGTAVAETLFGRVNPSGKLPITFYASDNQLPDYEDYHMTGRTYRYLPTDVCPLFPFGHGLSYTRFRLSRPRYEQGRLRVNLQNKGRRDGTEVIQVYLRRNDDHEGPVRTLRAFQRVSLKAGERKQVSIEFPRERFETWDAESNAMRVVPGDYTLYVGTSSNESDLQRINVHLNE